ncbi:MAG: aminotransferase class III-fold pyridoxal phosphate-dependent enzyme [Spirochaeta sp.]|nr:aminotransferase class III-fold pyridoxal phosphate-dependent enzyme [Spirochaeta sp.]
MSGLENRGLKKRNYSAIVNMMELINHLPPIKRARGYRLYDYNQRVYLDLYQEGGRAILGHRAFRLTTVIKDVISKGTIFDLPSIYTKRLEQALRRRFPEFPYVYLAASPEGALRTAALYLGREISSSDICDPFRRTERRGDILRRYPLVKDAQAEEGVSVLMPVIPFSMGGSPSVLCFRHGPPEGFPLSETISPVILAGALRALNDLKNYRQADWFKEDLLKGKGGWLQRGIYITANFEEDFYAEVFKNFLEEGVLLNPGYPGPSILPAAASPGELKRMVDLFSKYPG